MPKAFKVPIPSAHLLWALRVLSKKTYDSQHVRHHILSYLTPFQMNQLDEAIDIVCATPGAHKIYVTRNVTMSDIDFVGCIEKRKTVLLLSKEKALEVEALVAAFVRLRFAWGATRVGCEWSREVPESRYRSW